MKKLFLLLLTMATIAVASAQTRTVTGQVVYAGDGEPLMGATVMPVGGGNGIATNIDGEFTLKVPADVKKLRISYVGMVTRDVDITEGKMLIKLTQSDTKLDEVMVVAFGTTKKSAFTGSAAVVNAEDISKHITTNVADALVGSVPGLQIRGGSGAPGSGNGSISIRGISSIYANKDPLIIVDGAPYTASLSNIPQSDIESISVLKDAASAALYGARGASGVIIITTKRGNTREAQVSADVKWGINARAIQDYDVFRDPAEYYQAYYTQLYNYQFYGNGATAEAANLWANNRLISDVGYNVYTVPEGEQLIGMNGLINPRATLGRRYEWNGMEYYMTPDDWIDLAYRNGFRQEYNVSINGGSDRASFYTSINYLNEEGVIEYSSFDRINGRLKADYQAKKWLKVGANVSYTHSKTVSNPNLSTGLNSTNIMYYTSNMAPIYPAYVRVIGPDGQPMIKIDEFGHEKYDYGVAATNYGVTRPFLATGNPLGSNRYNDVYSIGDQLNASVNVDVTFTDYLKFNATSTVILGLTQSSNYQNPFEGPKVSVNGALTKSNTTNTRTNNSQTLTFFKNFGDNYVNLLAGHEYYRTTGKYLAADATGGFSPAIPEINAFANKTDSYSYTNNYNVEGFFFNAQYNYLEKYFASASFRRDASSYFAKDHRWGNFWSVGAAWLLDKENFLSNVSWLNQLKLKLSIGQQGNDNIGSYAYIDLYTLNKASDTSMSPSFNRMGNPNITWETTTNFNAGVEFGVLNNRLSGTVDLYTKKTSDLLFWLSIPESMGSRGYYGNVGDIRNSGVELTLTGSLVRTRDYDVTLTANLSHNSTKILSLPESKTADNGGFYESSLWYAEGQPLYNYMTLSYAGVNDQGEALYWRDPDLVSESGAMITSRPGKNKTETTTIAGEATRYTVGSILPKIFGGFNLTARAKGFDCSAAFDYQIGGKVYDSRYAGLMGPSSAASGGNFHKDILKAWSPNNTSSNIPRWQYMDRYATSGSDRFLTNASYLNFQSFTVGYTLPKDLLKEISKIRVYVAGENICFWSARKGLDPRYSYTGNTSVNVQSPVRTIMGGLQVNF